MVTPWVFVIAYNGLEGQAAKATLRLAQHFAGLQAIALPFEPVGDLFQFGPKLLLRGPEFHLNSSRPISTGTACRRC